jgi:hypothetical protein
MTGDGGAASLWIPPEKPELSQEDEARRPRTVARPSRACGAADLDLRGPHVGDVRLGGRAVEPCDQARSNPVRHHGQSGEGL